MQRILVENLHFKYCDLPAQREHRPTLVMLHEGLGCVAMRRQLSDRLAAAIGCRVLAYRAAVMGSPMLTLRRDKRLSVTNNQVSLKNRTNGG